MRSIRLLGAVFCAWALSTACGDEGGDDGGGNTAGTAGAGGGGSVGLPPGVQVVGSNLVTPLAGECMSPANCVGGTGMGCAAVPSGYRVCTFQTAQATMPSAIPSADQCDASRPCEAGGCFNIQVFPNGVCDTGRPSSYNVCRDNQCTMDSDCPTGSICGPAGFSATEEYAGGTIRQCLLASCTSNSDCRAGGVCSVVQAGCDLPAADNTQAYLPPQMACVYANGCTSTSNCPNGAVCKVIGNEGVCIRRAS
jgi:hypothetical protein